MAETTDSGKGWHSISIDTGSREDPVRQIAALDAEHIWLLHSNRLSVTTDGGHNWHQRALPDSLANILSAVELLDSSTAILGGGGLLLVRTTDAGVNWQIVSPPFRPVNSTDYDIVAIRFAGDSLGLAIGANYQTFVLRSTDRGMTWNQIDGGVGIEGAVAQGSAASLSMPSDSVSFFCTNQQLFYSSDKGLNWTPRGIRYPFGLFLRDIAFIDSSFGIALSAGATDGSGNLRLGGTRDGGISWSTILDFQQESSAGYVSFVSRSKAFANGFDRLYENNDPMLGVAVGTKSDAVSHWNLTGGLFEIECAGGRVRVQVFDLLGRVQFDEESPTFGRWTIDLRRLTGELIVAVSTREEAYTIPLLYK